TADVVETDISKINVNQPATVTIGAISSDVAGTVAAISPSSSTSSRSGSSGSVVSYAVTVTLTHPPAALKSGMTADITITTASATNVLTVPAAALNGSTGNYTVRVLGPDGTAPVRPAAVGAPTGRRRAGRSRSGSSPARSPRSRAASTRARRSSPVPPASATRRSRTGSGRVAGRSPAPGAAVAGSRAADRATDDGRADHPPRPGQPDVRDGPGRRPRAARRLARGRARRVRRDRRAVWLRQEHDDEHPGLSRPADRRPLRPRRDAGRGPRRRRAGAAAEPVHRFRLPVLQPAAADVGARQRR